MRSRSKIPMNGKVALLAVVPKVCSLVHVSGDTSANPFSRWHAFVIGERKLLHMFLNFSVTVTPDFRCSVWNIYKNIRQGWRTFLRARAQISYKFGRFFFRVPIGNF